MQYKVTFLLLSIGQFIASFIIFLGIYFMFLRFNQINDYTYTEVLICFSIVLTSFSLAECFFRSFDTFGSIINNGEFDRIMVRPKSIILQVLGSKIDFSRLSRMLQAILIMLYVLPRSEIDWTLGKVLLLFIMILSGAILFSGLFLVYAALCFFTIEGLEFMNVFTDGAREFGRYPLSVYGKKVLKITTFLIPYSCFLYYPYLYLIGRSNNRLYTLLPLVAALFYLPCYGIWRIGLRHYKSTGS